MIVNINMKKDRFATRRRAHTHVCTCKEITLRQVKTVVKWTLIVGGVLYFSDMMNTDNDEVTIVA